MTPKPPKSQGSPVARSVGRIDGTSESEASMRASPSPSAQGGGHAALSARVGLLGGHRNKHPHALESELQVRHDARVPGGASPRFRSDTPSPPASKGAKPEDTSKGAVVGTIGHVRCRGIKADGTACEATPQAGSPYCFFHDPEKAEERAIARRQGGLERSKDLAAVPENEPDLRLASARDVVRLLGDTVARVRKGTLDPRIANSIGYLATVALRAHEVGSLEERIEQLESASNPPKAQRRADDWIEDNL